jgi:L-rhamnose-H+ transport protein
LIASIFVPHVFLILKEAPRSSIGWAVLFGVLWGIGGLTFGLAVRYLGVALGYAIALGLCTAFGTLIPPIYAGKLGAIAHTTSGQVILLGVAVCLLAVVINGLAGWSKEREVTPEEKIEMGEKEFSLFRGITVAIFAGIMSSFFAFGLAAGKPIGTIAKTHLLAEGRLDLWQNLPVLVVVLWGGFASNLVWSVILIVKNKSVMQFTGTPGDNPMQAGKISGETLEDINPTVDPAQRIAPGILLQNYAFAALAGVIWYFQFFFYSMGQTKMGRYDFSSWTLHMASIILFATLWGLVLKEWTGTSRRTRLLVALGLATLIGSTLIIGWGNRIQANADASATPVREKATIRQESFPLGQPARHHDLCYKQKTFEYGSYGEARSLWNLFSV